MDLTLNGSDEEIENLCKEVVRNLDNDEENSSLELLRRLCGKSACECVPLTPHQHLGHLVRVDPAAAGLGLGAGLSMLSSLAPREQCRPSLQLLLRESLRPDAAPDQRRELFHQRLWAHPGLVDFDIDVIEEFLLSESRHLEEDVLNMFASAADANTLSQAPHCTRLVTWSAKSAKIFSAVTSIMNSCLSEVADTGDQYSSGFTVIKQFITSVKLKCLENKTDFVCLYPCEFHGLVTKIDIKPECYMQGSESRTSLSLSSVVKLIQQSLQTNRVQMLCILTHFPQWIEWVVNR